MKVRDIMTQDPACCSSRDTLEKAAHLMEEFDCGCIPVVEDGEDNVVIGVITDRDIAVRAVGHGLKGDTPVAEVMTEEVCCCSADADLGTVEQLMADRQIRRIVVVDDGGCCVGMVAQADLARAAESNRDVTDEEVGRIVERISEPANESWRPAAQA